MLRFLRLFAQFRALEADRDAQVVALRESLQSEAQRALLLQDRLEAMQNERAEMWSMIRECVNGERTAYQAHINASWQKQGHGTPYPDAPSLPANVIPRVDTTPIGRRPLPSEAMAAAKSQFLQGLKNH